MTEDARRLATAILQQLQDAWNAADGAAFAAAFTEDVDFINGFLMVSRGLPPHPPTPRTRHNMWGLLSGA